MLHHIEQLSIWEISHRWHDEDPNQPEKPSPSLVVQDTIRLIIKAIDNYDISICTPNGKERSNPKDFIDFEDFTPPDDWKDKFDTGHRPSLDSDTEFDAALKELSIKTGTDEIYDTEDYLWDLYNEYHRDWNRHHKNATDRLNEIIESRDFEKSVLESIHLNRENIAQLCRLYILELPRFWFTDIEQKQLLNTADEDIIKGSLTQGKIDQFWGKLKHKQIARILCREIATKLWKSNPNMTIADVCNHEAIQRYGDGANYGGRETLRNWVKDLDPRPIQTKQGPKLSQP